MLPFSHTVKHYTCRAAVLAARPIRYLRGRLPHGVFVLLLAVSVGALAGTGAFILKQLIAFVSRKLTEGIGGPSLLFVVLPVAGILLAGLYQRYVLHHNIEHGTERIKKQLDSHNYDVPSDLVYTPVIACTFTLGFGGSAGSEGPIATAGAAIGSNLAKAAGLSPSLKRMMVAIGAGAGIAGIFKSAVGGAMFTLEVLGLGMANLALLALFCACIVAALTAYLWSGCTPDVAFIPAESFEPSILPAVLVLGVFCGLYGVYYSYTAVRTRGLLESISRPMVRNIASGLALGLMIFLFPVLWGEGYGVLATVINEGEPHLMSDSIFAFADMPSWVPLAVVGGVLLCKGSAATLTNSGGGVAGDFAPTLFAGCMAGYLFSMAANAIFGLGLCPQTFALLGMAGAMSAIIRAPLMAIFITAEMTWNYEYFLPLTLVAAAAYFTARIIRPNHG
ncbi:MAG: chloride channel protein [Muribaculaceae bacterium]|nr:chloride channel protein [Muribaculaceae bacterium]